MNLLFWRKPKVWNVKAINAFADYIETYADFSIDGTYGAAQGFFVEEANKYGMFDRKTLAKNLGLEYYKINQIFFPKSEGCIGAKVIIYPEMVSNMLRRLAKTGQVKWIG